METPDLPRILVVDDLPENILRIVEAIKHLDARIITSASSREAYKLTQELEFAVLILDVHMPGLNGFDLLQLIHEGSLNKYTPVIFISAVYFDDHSIFKGYETGAVDYIVKPVNLKILESKVKVFLQLEKSRMDLEKAKQEAENAREEKMMFLAKISHEIRNPLSAIIGIVNLLDPDELPPEWMERMDMIQFSALHMHNLLNDLLDLSKIESFALKIVAEPVRLREELSQLLRANRVLCKMQQNKVDFVFDPNIPEIVIGDALRYKQIVLNLLGNANKFTHNGEIAIRVSLEKEEKIQYIIKTSVSDNGVGIDEKDQGDLFKPFSQFNQSITKKYGGSGLGLVVAKNMAQLLGGDLFFESKVNEGTYFWFTSVFLKA